MPYSSKEKQRIHFQTYKTKHKEEFKLLPCLRCKINLRHDLCYCVQCRRELSTKWHHDNPERVKELRFQRKLKVLYHYGDCCACCGVSEPRFLSLDHIEGGGNQQRKELRARGWNFYMWIVKNNYPKGFQVLCMNCNFAKGMYGKCPHQK